MKLNISYPVTGQQKLIEIDDEQKLRNFYDKRMSHEVDGGAVSDEFKGYIFRISGGNDKEGFPMKQGVLTNTRVRLLLSDGHSCYRTRRPGDRKRKSVRGCIVGSDLSVISLVIVKKGENDIPGLTDDQKPRRLGPKRATRIRKLFNLSKEDDVRRYVVRRTITRENKKPYAKAPKIQRLITPERLQRKRHERAVKRHRWEKSRKQAEEYMAMMAKYHKERDEQRAALKAKRRSHSRRDSAKQEDQSKKAKEDKKPAAPAPAPAAAAPAADKKKGAKAAKTDKKAAPPAKESGKPSAKSSKATPASKAPQKKK